MGRISKEELYAIKKVPTLGDTVIGTDAQNKDITVQFPVEAFGEGGDGSTIFNNNRFKKVEIGDAVTPSEVATLINNITPTVEVLADEVVLFSSLRPPQKEGEISSLQLWALQGVGKGTYGVGGTITVLDSQPFIIDSGLTVGVFNPGDVINSELVDLGDFSSSTNLVDIKNDLISTINASSSTYVIESGTNWYFEGNVVGRGRVLYGWQGPNGTYGNGGSLANSNDLFLIIDEGSQEAEGPTGLESITEGGNQGWRLKFRDPQNYGDIGEGAIDFSKSTQPSSTNGATGEGSIAYGVDVKAPGFGSFVSGGNSEISGTFNSGFGNFLISNGYGSLITGFDNVENSQFGYNFTSGTGNRLGVSGGIGSGVLLEQGGGLATAVFGAANEEITYNAVGDYDRQPMIIVGNGTHTTPSGSSWVAIKRSNLLVGLRNGELILPSTSIARIDAELTGRQITTKEWVLSKISSGSVGGGIPDAPVDGESYVRKDGAWVPLPDLSTNPVENDYSDIAAMLLDQSNQTEGFFQFVLDDGTGEEAYYEKLSSSTSDISDYRKMSDDEVEVITNSNAWNLLRVKSIDENTSTLNSVGGGRVRVEYDAVDNLVTSFLFNKKYSEAIVNVIPLISVNNIYIQAYNRNTKIIELCKVSNSEVQGDYVRLFVEKSILSTNITLDDRLSFTFDLSEVSSGGDVTLTKDVNQVAHGFSVGSVIRLEGNNYVKAQADSISNANAISFVVSVTDFDNFVLQPEGYTNISLGLSNGEEAFLSTTELGGIQTTEPLEGEVNLYLGQKTPQGFLISISTGFVVEGSSSNGGSLPTTQTNTINLKNVSDQTYDITEEDNHYLINVSYDGNWNVNLPNINSVTQDFEIYISHKENENAVGNIIPYSNDSVHRGSSIGMIGKGLLNIKKIKIDESNSKWFLSNQESYNSLDSGSTTRRIDFENENNIQVQHNLGFIPIVQVWVEDGAGGFVEANVDIDHDWSGMNSFEVQLISTQSGKIIY